MIKTVHAKKTVSTQASSNSHLGTGRVSKPLLTLDDFPTLIIGIGLVSLSVGVFNLNTQGVSVYSAPGITFPLVTGVICIYVGIRRWILNLHKHKHRPKRCLGEKMLSAEKQSDRR